MSNIGIGGDQTTQVVIGAVVCIIVIVGLILYFKNKPQQFTFGYGGSNASNASNENVII